MAKCIDFSMFNSPLTGYCRHINSTFFYFAFALLRKTNTDRLPFAACGTVATRLFSSPGTFMQTCGLATARSADVRMACRHAFGGGAARSLSSPVARKTRWQQRGQSSGVRPSRAGGVQIVAAAAAAKSCRRDLLVVGPGVLGSLVCQRWLNVRAEAFPCPRFFPGRAFDFRRFQSSG